jgi:hypothetical protein
VNGTDGASGASGPTGMYQMGQGFLVVRSMWS